MSTYSSNLKIELIGTGEQVGTWGTTTNSNFANVFEQAIVGRGNPNYASDANLTLTYTDSVASQTARNLYLNVTSTVVGGLTATRELVVPTINKNYIIQNNTTGGQSITVKTSAGTGVTIPNGTTVPVYVDGTNVIQAFDYLPSLNIGTLDLTNIEVTNIKAKDGTASASIANGTGVMTITNLAGTTANITNVNATTVDTTNIEVTNIKAKDGTAAGSIADTTGVVTLASSVLTTTDINGGTIDGTAIGSASASTGAFTTLAASGVATFSAGTAAAPAITTTGDTNTGVFFPAADTIAFTEGGVEAMRIDSSANLLIGTTTNTNSSRLVANGTISETVSSVQYLVASQYDVGTDPNQIPLNQYLGSLAYQDGNAVALTGGSISGNYSSTGLNIDSNTFVIDATNNNVGIGTSSPNAALFVAKQSASVTSSVVGVGIGSSSSTASIELFGSASSGAGIIDFAPADGATDFKGRINYDLTNNYFRFYTNATERMRLDSSGNLGLGVTPSAWGGTNKALQLGSGASINGSGAITQFIAAANRYNNGTNDIYIGTGQASVYQQLSGQHQWFTAPSGTAGNTITFTQAMTLDASGRLLLGTTSTRSGLAYMQTTEGGNIAGNITVRNTADSGGPVSILAKSRGTTVGSVTVVAANDVLGTQLFYGTDGTGLIPAASIFAAVDGTPGTNDMPGRLVFSTTADGAAGVTERMRIDSAGNMGLGVTPSAWNSLWKVMQAGAGTALVGSTNAELTILSTNAYSDTTNFSSPKYIATGTASHYRQQSGGHQWFTAPSGTAGNTITFTQAMTLDASGNLGIGSTSPGGLGGSKVYISGTNSGLYSTASTYPGVDVTDYSGLAINNASATTGSFVQFAGFIRNASNTIQVGGMSFISTASGSSPDIAFWQRTGAGTSAERMRIDSSGRVLIGTSTNIDSSKLQVVDGPQSLSTFTNTSGAYLQRFNKSRSSTTGTNTIVQSGDTLGGLSFHGADGTGYIEAASIFAVCNGTPGTNDMPGALLFRTTADGASSPTERARITSDGYLRLTSSALGIQFNGDTAAANSLNDYEEGTFTPTISGSTTAGTGTYTTQVGTYTKIGNLVYWTARVTWTAHTGTGNLRMSVPLTSATITNGIYGQNTPEFLNMTMPANTVPYVAIGSNSALAVFGTMALGTGVVSNLAMDTAATIYASGVYRTP